MDRLDGGWLRGVTLPFLLAGIITLAGCAPQPTLEVDPGEMRGTVERLERRLEQRPDDTETLRDLGALYVLTKRPRQGQGVLMRAFEADANDPKTLFYLGLAAERLRRFDQALQLYERYPEVPSASPYRAALQGRHELVLRRLVEEEARRAVTRCLRDGTCSAAAPSTVAVLPLRYQGGNQRFAPLGLGIAELVSIDLAHVDAITVVERVRLQALLDEIDRAQGPGFNQNVGPQTGRLIGAGQLVGGAFTVENDRAVRLNMRVSGVDGTSRSLQTESAQLDRIFAVQKAIVFGVVDALGIELTAAERAAIQFVPTESLQAFLAYCRGLDAERQGLYSRAARAYGQARALDPGFQAAVRRATETTALGQAASGLLPAPLLETAVDLSALRLANMPSIDGVFSLPAPRDPDGEWSRTSGDLGLPPLPLPPEPSTGGN
jgi:tetratricopeptide (TPR) repeat protein